MPFSFMCCYGVSCDEVNLGPLVDWFEFQFVFAWLVRNRQRAPWQSRGAWRFCLGHKVLSCMTCVVILFLLSHSSRVLSGGGLVGGNPTMNTPRLRRGEGG